MVTVKKQDGKLTIDFSSTMFFEEIVKAPSEKRKELISKIAERDSEWLFNFCVENFGTKIFYFDKKED